MARVCLRPQERRLDSVNIVDAHWDTRNLGVRTAELSFSRGEEVDSAAIDAVLAEYDYVVAKVEPGAMEAMEALQDLGFAFVECSITMAHTLAGIERSDDELSGYGLADTPAAIDYILSRIGEGIFSTDRIFLDPAFTPEIAAARYVSWIKDELGRGSLLYDVLYGADRIGFFAYKEPEPGVSYPFLIGLYPEFQGRRLGSVLLLESLRASLDRGCTASSTVVSSNNPPIIRAHRNVGSYMDGMRYVFVWHSTRG